MNTVKSKATKHSISSAFIFLLVGVFAVFSLLLVLIGVGAYRGVVEDASQNAQVRTSLSYIANKVRAADATGEVRVEDWQGVPVLVMQEWYDADLYETRLYFLPDEQGGGLYEHFMYTGDAQDWTPADGDRIADISALTIKSEAGRLVLGMTTTDGQPLTLRLALRAAAQ